MAILNPWLRQEIEVMVMGDNGEVHTYKFMRVMLDYAQAIQDGYSDKDIKEMMDVTDTDVGNWTVLYPKYPVYLKQMAHQKAFASQITKDLALGLLGQAALGKRELTNQQLAAIKLIMQSNEMLTKGPKVKAEKPVITKFELQEKDGTNGK